MRHARMDNMTTKEKIMSIQNALLCIKLVRSHRAKRNQSQVEALPTWSPRRMVEYGCKHGLVFSRQELQQAFLLDWSMRARKFGFLSKKTIRGDCPVELDP